MSNVIDMLSRRQQRGETVIHFRTAVEALDYATRQIHDLQAKAESAVLLDGRELDLPLAQAAAILTEVTRLHAGIKRDEAQ